MALTLRRPQGNTRRGQNPSVFLSVLPTLSCLLPRPVNTHDLQPTMLLLGSACLSGALSLMCAAAPTPLSLSLLMLKSLRCWALHEVQAPQGSAANSLCGEISHHTSITISTIQTIVSDQYLLQAYILQAPGVGDTHGHREGANQQ